MKLIHTRRGAGYTFEVRCKTLRIESVRGRLTLFYVSVLAAALILVGGLIYVLLRGRSSPSRREPARGGADHDDVAHQRSGRRPGLRGCGPEHRGGASSSGRCLPLRRDGRLLAESGRDGDLEIVLPPLDGDPR